MKSIQQENKCKPRGKLLQWDVPAYTMKLASRQYSPHSRGPAHLTAQWAVKYTSKSKTFSKESPNASVLLLFRLEFFVEAEPHRGGMSWMGYEGKSSTRTAGRIFRAGPSPPARLGTWAGQPRACLPTLNTLHALICLNVPFNGTLTPQSLPQVPFNTDFC